MTLVSVALQIAIAVVVFIVVAALVEAMRRRGWDPVARIAAVLSPSLDSDTTSPPESY